MRYIYCPKCGEKLTSRQAGDDGAVPYCESCRKYWFDTFAHCVIVLVYNELDEIVLCMQPHLSDRFSSFVSGYIQPGETAEETALREVEEEIGIRLERLRYIRSVWFGKNDMLMSAYTGYAPKAELKLSQEIASAQWVPYQEAPKTMFPEHPESAMWVLYRQFLKEKME